MGDSISDYWNYGMDLYKKAVNVVMSYGDYEIKVRDATTNEPWGASSKLMLEIAEATHSYQGFNEVMETILKRFQEPKEKWRCVYKALTLLEYLVKHGAERVIDFARDHIYDIKALKNFHYVSDKGKDEGLNVRNRAKELAELLADTDRIKAERKKAKANRSKYTGVSADEMRSGASGFGSGSSSRYQGFGSDSFRGTGSNDDVGRSHYDTDDRAARRSPSPSMPPRSGKSMAESANKPTPPIPPAPKDLVDLLDDFSFEPASGGAAMGDDDEFGGFESATASTSVTSAPPPSSSGVPKMGTGVTATWANFAMPPTAGSMPSAAGRMGGTQSSAPPVSLPPPLPASSVAPAKPADPFADLFDISASALAPKQKNEGGSSIPSTIAPKTDFTSIPTRSGDSLI